MMDLRTRVAGALRSRLAPNTGVHTKQLAHGIGRSTEAIRQWLNAETAIKAEDLAAVARFFGDPRFLGEVYGDLLPGASRRQQPTIAAPSRDLFLWFTSKGVTHDAPAGHADFARRALNLSIHVAGDIELYVRRNLGWISLEWRRDGRASVRYDDRGIDVNAARAASAWLVQRINSIESVRRVVTIGDQSADLGESEPQHASEAIMRAAEIARTPQRVSWRVDRLPLDAVAAFQPYLEAYAEAPGQIIESVARMGTLALCSLLRVRGNDVETISIGSHVPVPHGAEFIGRNVLARADSAYGEVLHQHMIEATTGGPTAYWLRGSIYARPVSYNRLAMYAGDESGLVVSVPILRPSEEALANA